ncbi:hypothetical protein HMPREF1633_06325 [Tissierellia bacterium S5-A11]|nr:hypothetical protein HMPREF1633_06325 [Tissierellia bacterium S5-A11]
MLKDTIIKRRTVRRFTDEKMPLETLKELLMYASMAPSNANAHPVEFIVVSEKEDFAYLAAMDRFGAKHLADAPLAVLIVANKDVCKYWVQEAAMTTAYLDLLVQEEGYQAGYLPFHDNTTDKNKDAEAYVRDYFNIPDNYGALGILSIGKKDERVRTRKEFPIDEKIHENRF